MKKKHSIELTNVGERVGTNVGAKVGLNVGVNVGVVVGLECDGVRDRLYWYKTKNNSMHVRKEITPSYVEWLNENCQEKYIQLYLLKLVIHLDSSFA